MRSDCICMALFANVSHSKGFTPFYKSSFFLHYLHYCMMVTSYTNYWCIVFCFSPSLLMRGDLCALWPLMSFVFSKKCLAKIFETL